MTSSTDIRYRNFMFLVNGIIDANNGIARGALVEVSEKTKIPQRQLSHIKTKRRNIGAATARTIEKAFALPDGWLDTTHDLTEPSDDKEAQFLKSALSAFRYDAARANAAIYSILSEMAEKYMGSKM